LSVCASEVLRRKDVGNVEKVEHFIANSWDWHFFDNENNAKMSMVQSW